MKSSIRTRYEAVLVLAMSAVGFAGACSGDDNAGGSGPMDAASDRTGGTGGMSEGGPGGSTGTGGTTGTGGNAGMTADSGSDVDASTVEDAGNGEPDAVTVDVPVILPDPALAPDAGTIGCPTIVNASLDPSDGRQTGRYSRIAPISACGMTKGNPSTSADPGNPHLYDVYRFANPTAAPVCFTFTLTYGPVAEGGSETVVDAASTDGPGADALDARDEERASAEDARAESSSADGGDDAVSQDGNAQGAADAVFTDAAGSDGSDGGVPAIPPPAKHLAAFTTFYPTNLNLGYVGDVGDKLTSPQTMGITVPAGGTIDVVVYAIDVAPAGVGSYTLACSAQ